MVQSLKVDISFCSEFSSEYVRMNKKAGQKRVRCFPHCNHDQHNPNGFCGGAVRAEVLVEVDELCDHWDYLDSLIITGKIAPTETAETELKTVPLEFLTVTSLCDVIIGKKKDIKQQDPASRQFVITVVFEPKLWNYIWDGSKRKGQKPKHIFQVSVLEPNDTDLTNLNVLSTKWSSFFKISCSRRNKLNRLHDEDEPRSTCNSCSYDVSNPPRLVMPTEEPMTLFEYEDDFLDSLENACLTLCDRTVEEALHNMM